MAKYYLQEMGDMQRDGKTKVYPKLMVYSQISQEDFIKSIRSRAGIFSEGVAEGLFITMAECLTDWLSEGHTVKIEGLGTFSLSLGFTDDKGNEMEDELTDKRRIRKVEVRSVKFKPDPELLKEVQQKTTLEREMTGVKRVLQQKYSMEEKLQRALEKIESQGFITLQQYANLNKVCRTIASKELNAFAKDPSSGITTMGQASHKVWIKKAE